MPITIEIYIHNTPEVRRNNKNTILKEKSLVFLIKKQEKKIKTKQWNIKQYTAIYKKKRKKYLAHLHMKNCSVMKTY